MEAKTAQKTQATANEVSVEQENTAQATSAKVSVLPPVNKFGTFKLYSVDEIAKIIGMSHSYVHQAVAILQPEVAWKEGRRYLYKWEFIEQLLQSK